MATKNATPFTFSPTSLSDCLDATHAFTGACARLTNLIPDPSTTNLWQCRPAAIRLTDFGDFDTPGFISALKVIGTRAYGMIASNLNPGKDEPFCYDIPSGTFVTITGVTNVNSPASPVTSGDWIPPIMVLVGRFLIVTHPGYTGAGGAFFGWLDLMDPGAPVWNAGNTTGVPLPFPPTWVDNFFGRAYFGVNPPNTTNPATYATDPLTLNISAGPPSQILTYDDNVDLIAGKGLALKNQLGGIIQALMVFKPSLNIHQVTGDFALPTTNPISVNALNMAIGTDAPLSIISTPYGLGFIARDGFRLIDFTATITDPIGIAGMGVSVPFINALVKSRIASACNASTMRITTQNGGISGAPFEEYWFNFARKVWSGPHTFAASLIQPYANTFVMSPVGVEASLWQSDVVPSTTSTYVENDEQLLWDLTTSMFPDPGFVGQYDINETTINMAIDPSMGDWTASLLNADAAQYDAVTTPVPASVPIWDAAVWDSDVWDGESTGLLPRKIPWTKPVPTSRVQMKITGQSAAGVRIGDIKINKGIVNYVPPVGL
jgi:hypothetical protein